MGEQEDNEKDERLMNMIGSHIDIVIALALLVIIVIVFMVGQTGLLPKRSLPFLAAALAALFGIAIFRSWRKSQLLQELKKREDDLKEQDKRLDKLKETVDVSMEDLNKVNAEVTKQLAAHKKEVLLIDAKNNDEIKRIDSLSEDEVFSEFARTVGGNG